MRSLYKNFFFGLDLEPQQMLVEKGRVVERSRHTAQDADKVVDLGGKSVLPAFIDNHCHILPTGIDLGRLNLGSCSTKEEVLDAVRDRLVSVEDGQWLRAVHYDQTKFADGIHLTSHDLDKISVTVPMLLRHVNGHAGVANSAALQAAKVNDSTPDPDGGQFVRDAAGHLTGVLLEDAEDVVSEAAPKANLEQMIQAILLAGERMHELGITCACDMATGQFDLDIELQAYRMAAERGCKIRTALYVHWSALLGPRRIAPERLRELTDGMDKETCRIAGVKIFADGAIGSATAAIYEEFEGGGGDGQLIYSPERLKKMVRVAHEAGYQIAIHSIGDRSTDLVMEAYEQLDDPKRHRIEHAMIMSDAQIERMARLGVHCSMQPEFLMRFGHSYRRQLGLERASKLNRVNSFLTAGIPLSFSSDRPIVAGDPLDGIEILCRRPPEFDQAENISLDQAMAGYHADAAAAMLEPVLGSLDPGQLADFLVVEPAENLREAVLQKRLTFSTKMAQIVEPAPVAGR